MNKPECPLCGSRNTRMRSAMTISEQYHIAETSHRCGKCKKIFYRRFKIIEPKYKFHPYFKWGSDDFGNYTIQPNERKDDGPN